MNLESVEPSLIECDVARHGPAILAIFNHAIAHTTALYEYQPRSLEFIQHWFASKQASACPILGLVDAQANLLGFATWGPFRAFPAYQYSMEHSVYIRADQHGRGYGRRLLQALLERASRAHVHVLIGCIDAANAPSIGLHQQLGFTHVGTFKQVGYKFERWLDAAFYQRILTHPGG